MVRIQPGIHGPTLLLPDDHAERAALDDIEIEVGFDGIDNEALVVKLRRNGHSVNAFVLTNREKEVA